MSHHSILGDIVHTEGTYTGFTDYSDICIVVHRDHGTCGQGDIQFLLDEIRESIKARDFVYCSKICTTLFTRMVNSGQGLSIPILQIPETADSEIFTVEKRLSNNVCKAFWRTILEGAILGNHQDIIKWAHIVSGRKIDES